ncbi:ThuA domain-containing protein [uncultured Bacteroides sp.]|uniref:ThuA domain-containing protein n=1 Tax=uncultured Bacteroides sp. TaxID=162156 RepID=UPI002AA76B6A|nr:ThuA domain-containing protein [uncultured Bacteroides sp.]
MKRRIILFAVFIILVGSFTAMQAQKKVIKTMIITGQDGSHYWQGASNALKQILENSGLFKVDINVTPNFGGNIAEFKPDFSKYNLIVIDYGGATWSEPVRKNFEKYVADGGGVVIIHSSVVPMADWKGYNEIIGMGAWEGRNEKDGPYLYWKDGKYVYDYSPGWAGYHGLQHESVVDNRATEHPILKGLNLRWKHFKDEIYCHLRGPEKNMEILATVNEKGRDEPVMWTVRPGKGRVFVSVLGHCGNDPNMIYSMKCTGYQVTLLRGAEWAATGEVTQKVPNDFPLEDTYTLRPDFKAPFNAYIN